MAKSSHDDLEVDYSGSKWYVSRKEIEEKSPSRRDGIDLKKETYLRKSYCTFLQDLGMRLKVPQVTIATAIVFCHRFFLCQSHAKNDRRTIATVCMFLAGKVEETPRSLKDVILVSYEIIHKKDPSAAQKIKQKEVYEEQKELILIGERLVLATLAFEFNVHHPYKPLVEAIKKFKVAQNALAQVAWNFVNDGLRTSLCLQYKPHHIAAGAIFLAAKFLKVKLPSDGEKVWWQEFDVTPRQLEDISNQMLELYEQTKPGQTSHASEEGSTVGGSHNQVATISTVTVNSVSSAQKQDDGNRSIDKKSRDHQKDGDYKGEVIPDGQQIAPQISSHLKSRTNVFSRDNAINEQVLAAKEQKDGAHFFYDEGEKGFSPDAEPGFDKEKGQAALEKRQRLQMAFRKNDMMDDDDLIENGIELFMDDGSTKQERSQIRPGSQLIEQAGSRIAKNIKKSDQKHLNGKTMSKSINSEDRFRQGDYEPDFENAEEGELSNLDEQGFPSMKQQNSSIKVNTILQSSDDCGTSKQESIKRKRNEYECVLSR